MEKFENIKLENKILNRIWNIINETLENYNCILDFVCYGFCSCNSLWSVCPSGALRSPEITKIDLAHWSLSWKHWYHLLYFTFVFVWWFWPPGLLYSLFASPYAACGGLESNGWQGDGRGCLVCSRVRWWLDLEMGGDRGQHWLGDRGHGLWLVGLRVVPPWKAW